MSIIPFLTVLFFFIMSIILVRAGFKLLEYIPEMFPLGAFIAAEGLIGVVVLGGCIIWNIIA